MALLQPSIANALRAAGYIADEEDSKQLLRAGMPVWRSNDDGNVVPTSGRRRVDIVVYKGGTLVALIETESDLNDLRLAGVTKRNGHYDVASIARDGRGDFYHSYNSIERMAAAAFYWHSYQLSGTYPSPLLAVASLESVVSDEVMAHNPMELPLILVSGSCRQLDHQVLAPRLGSLGAKLICVRNK